MRWGLVAAIAGVLLVGGVGALFVVQNSSRPTQLSLDLGFAAWQLATPVPVPTLMGVCLGLGVVIGAGPLLLRNWRLASRVRDLEARATVDQAMSRDGGSAPPPGTW